MLIRRLGGAILATAVLVAPALAADPIVGPKAIALKDADATIQLPAHYMFIPKEEAQAMLEQSGNAPEGCIGIIAKPESEEKEPTSIVVVEWDDSGYVKDDDANKLNADELLKSYKEGTIEQNEKRKELGMEPFYCQGWSQKPNYNKAEHKLVWALTTTHEDSATAPVTGVNYCTRILGRRGVLSLNLLTEPKELEANKPQVVELLKNTSFNHGAEYKDYVAGKDKSAGYGLAGLILGGGAFAAAAKLGLLGGLWKWILGIVLVFKKFAIVAIAAIAAAVGKFFNRGKKEER